MVPHLNIFDPPIRRIFNAMHQGFEIDQVEEKVKLNVKGLQTGRRTYGRLPTGD